MRRFASLILVPTLLAALGARADDAAAPAAPPAAASVDDADTADLTALRTLEARLAAGVAVGDAERALPLRLVLEGKTPRVRALAAAVCAWLEPRVATPPLALAAADEAVLVRTTALSSLVSLSRRLDEAERQRALSAALLALDDKSDEVACGAMELVSVLAPSAVPDAARERATTASDLRYGCFARFAGLPPRAVATPPVPTAPSTDTAAPEPDAAAPPAEAPPPEAAAPQDGTWLVVIVGAATGAIVGGAVPGAFVLSRDVLTYTPDRTRVVRQEVSFFAQALGAVVGGAAGGGAGFGLAQLSPPTLADATTVALASGAGLLLGGSAPLMLGLDDRASVLTFAGAGAGGFALGLGLSWLTSLDANDHALAVALAGGGGLASALAVFAALPVGFDTVGGALRTDFGLGMAGLGAAAFGVAGLGLGALVDVPATRTMATLASGLMGAGLLGGAAFALIPASIDVKSRVACGLGLGGLVVGGVLGALLVPDSLFGATPAAGSAVHLDLERDRGGAGDGARVVRLGVPALVPLVDARGTGLGAQLVSASF